MHGEATQTLSAVSIFVIFEIFIIFFGYIVLNFDRVLNKINQILNE